MSGLIGQLGWTLLHFLWQGALIACVAGLGLVILRNNRPQARYALACAALLACVAWPLADLSMRLSVPAAAGVDGHRLLFSGVAATGGGGSLAWLQNHLDAIVLAWAACAAALSLRMLVGLWWIQRAAGSDRLNADWQARLGRLSVQFGITRAVRLRLVDNIASPLTAGWWRPVVLLPSSLLTGMPPDLLEALIAHELGHVKRFDYLVNLLQNIVETLLFYHPAVWCLSHRIRIERELIADDLAAEQVGGRRLALALSELEKRQFSQSELALAANGGNLMIRMKRLLRPDAQGLNWKAALPVLGLSAALVAACAQTPPTAAVPALRTSAFADFRSCAKPVWPAESLRNEETGIVTLGFLIDKDGNPVDSIIKRSSGHPLLDEAARSGVSKCHFIAATVNGVATPGWMQMQYVWTLE